MGQRDQDDVRETDELRRALGLIGVAALFAVLTGVAVVGLGSRALEAATPDRPVILVANR